ncbi:MAG TPA: hypothetical protein VNK43_10265 [Gemmatimonadales bacterium]|nr:hypothetical protein [Gemmatimonadales bacterium]
MRLATRLLPLLLAAPAALGSCRGAMSPLQNRLAVGQEPFVVFAARGEGGEGDLFAARADGGAVYPVTYSRIHEATPALDPSGIMLAFARARSAAESDRGAVWVMNLLTGQERRLTEPGRLGRIERIGWGRDGATLFLETAAGRYRVGAPPGPAELERVGGAEAPAAESALAVLLGEPPRARVTACPADSAAEPAAGSAPGLCVETAGGEVTPLAGRARDPLRWGTDSVAYFVGDELEVRPLAGGRTRRARWTRPPAEPREATYAAGRPAG